MRSISYRRAQQERMTMRAMNSRRDYWRSGWENPETPSLTHEERRAIAKKESNNMAVCSCYKCTQKDTKKARDIRAETYIKSQLGELKC